ncbi:MAG TPA: YbhN family protein [Actinomycetes bacterium]|nr:YbhN family protein [Actinomycetes bacterium]
MAVGPHGDDTAARDDAAVPGAEATTHPAPKPQVAGPQSPDIFATKKPSPIQSAVRISLTVLLLWLIFGVVIPSFADYATIWDSITSLSLEQFLLLSLMTVFVEITKALAPVTLLPGLTLRWSFVADEASAAVSNTIPGPSGTAMRYLTYRRYGLSASDFGRSTVVNSIWNNALLLLAPSVIIPVLAVVQPVPGRVLRIALLGLVISIVALILIIAIVRSERFAYRVGALLGRSINWARGLRNRPPAEDVGNTVVRFRHDTLDTVRQHWLPLSTVIVVKYLATYLVLLISLRAMGLDRELLTNLEVLAVYAFVRLLTLIEITPGGIGVVEVLYISALSWATDGVGEDEIVAGVFVFRMFTYLTPILIGAVCYVILSRKFGNLRREVVQHMDEGAGSLQSSDPVG